MKHMSIDEIVEVEIKKGTIGIKVKEGRILRITPGPLIKDTELADLKKGDTVLYMLDDQKLVDFYKLNKLYDDNGKAPFVKQRQIKLNRRDEY